MNGFFLIRLAYVVVCWGILYVPIKTSISEVQMFSSLMLFYLPLGLDYWKHIPRDSNDEWRKKIGVKLPIALFCVFLIVVIISYETPLPWLLKSYVKYTIWLLSGFFVWLALRDYISFSSPEEETSRKSTRDKQRERAFNWRQDIEERRSYYQKAKVKHHVIKNSRRSKRKRRGG